MSKLLPNLPIKDLTSETDYLGIIDKGNLIKLFLESNTEEFSEIKMFALYGEWGSGKSTLMKYLQKELMGSFNTFFFEAWEFESDSNLSFSLLEFLIKEGKSVADDVSGEILNVAEKLLRGFTKSVKLSIPGLSIDGKQIVEALESEKEKTFLELKEEFKIEFIGWEDLMTKGENSDYNIVFIDDLDRCEPENVLNLLSAIKLFFNYGKKTIFFFGIDKKAVKEAVKTKYGEVVKANEYLEKIFDISFSMPRENEILKLVRNYFPSSSIRQKEIEDNWDDAITIFFKEIKFNNPRRIKKVLNKYHLLKHIRTTQSKGKYLEHIPHIFIREGDKSSFFETILVLYFIILDEFYPEISKCLFDFEIKKNNYLGAIKDNVILSESQKSSNYNSIKVYFDTNMLRVPLNEVGGGFNNNKGAFYVVLGPINASQLSFNSISKVVNFKEFVPIEMSMDYMFFKYLKGNEITIVNCNELSKLTLLEIKNMVSKLL